MRVVFFAHYGALLGANRSLLNLIDGLADYGVRSHVVCRKDGDLLSALAMRGVPATVQPFALWTSKGRTTGVILHRLVRSARQLPGLIRQVRQWDADIIYTNTSVTPVGALVAGVMRRPHVWHLRELADLHFDLHFDCGTRAFRWIVSSADAVIAVSEAVRSHLLPGRWSRRARVIYNGVAYAEQFDRLRALARARPHDGQSYTFIMVGVIRPNKGQDVAIRALAMLANRFPHVRLMLVGGSDGQHPQYCRALARDLGIADRVEFTGFLADPYPVYLAADASLMCSKAEAMGRVTVEAMSACLPVIGHDTGGTPELIEHEHTGLLYRGGPEELAACMERFITDPAWARTLGDNGWRVARERYTVEAYAAQVYQVLQSVVQRRHAHALHK